MRLRPSGVRVPPGAQQQKITSLGKYFFAVYAWGTRKPQRTKRSEVCEAGARRGREHFVYYERSEIKNLVIRDRVPPGAQK